MATSNAKKASVGGGVAAAIISAILLVEGGYVNDPRDPGGETNRGITKAVAVEHGYTGSMRQLPEEKAREIYYDSYIKSPGFEPMLDISPAVARKLADSAVNVGVKRPSIWFQSALNALNRGGKDYKDVAVDGKVGQSSIVAYRSLQRVRGSTTACVLVIKLLDAQQAVYYMSLTRLSEYTVGWVSNRINNVPLNECKGGSV